TSLRPLGCAHSPRPLSHATHGAATLRTAERCVASGALPADSRTAARDALGKVCLVALALAARREDLSGTPDSQRPDGKTAAVCVRRTAHLCRILSESDSRERVKIPAPGSPGRNPQFQSRAELVRTTRQTPGSESGDQCPRAAPVSPAGPRLEHR